MRSEKEEVRRRGRRRRRSGVKKIAGFGDAGKY